LGGNLSKLVNRRLTKNRRIRLILDFGFLYTKYLKGGGDFQEDGEREIILIKHVF
jgi:hypothetical protein